MKEFFEKNKTLIVIIVAFIIGGLFGYLIFYLSKSFEIIQQLPSVTQIPKSEYSIRKYPNNVRFKSALSCEVLTSFVVFEGSKSSEEKEVTALINQGFSSATISIRENEMEFIPFEPKLGSRIPMFLDIARNDENKLTATYTARGTEGETYNTFVLDKNTGFASWTQNTATDSSILGSLPRTDISYFICR